MHQSIFANSPHQLISLWIINQEHLLSARVGLMILRLSSIIWVYGMLGTTLIGIIVDYCRTFVTDGVFPIINFTEVAVNSIEMVNHAVKVLSSNFNKNTAEKALFARYLVHVVGDMHQPLHSVALFNSTFPSGDRGGNSIKIILPDKSSQNLHSFWDAGGFRVQNDSWSLSRPLNLQNLTVLKSVAQQYMD